MLPRLEPTSAWRERKQPPLQMEQLYGLQCKDTQGVPDFSRAII